ncbi:MAG: dihydropteroate synthase [Pirellulaceae bacterium]|jgi:dihydropteroate synthase
MIDFTQLFTPASPRATSWQLRTRTLDLPLRPLVMGIVNVTPDSFSDGGKFFGRDVAIHHALSLAEQGADILDIGGESTRPYSESISAEEELARVIEVVREVCVRTTLPVSIDTSKASVAAAAVEAGAEVINDVTGLEGDPEMLAVAARTGAGVCAMHMQGTPQTMQDNPAYGDIVEDILGYLRDRKTALLEAGIAAENICLDPGIGFGKSHQHNLTLLANSHRFHALGCPLLVGHSRKGFIGKVLGDKDVDRTAATVGVSLMLASRGVQILRVHDVRETNDALRLYEASGGIDGRESRLD